jgi:hypothetical protein
VPSANDAPDAAVANPISVQPFRTSLAGPAMTEFPFPVARVSTFQSEDTSDSMIKPFLNVDALLKRPINAERLFTQKGLQTDRAYVETASLIDPVRSQKTSEMGAYAWNAFGYTWESAAFCFSPLYFEQPNFERYGQGVGRPFASTASAVEFVADVTTLPIAVICTPPWSCSCSLGHHRPGDCAPRQGKTANH